MNWETVRLKSGTREASRVRSNARKAVFIFSKPGTGKAQSLLWDLAIPAHVGSSHVFVLLSSSVRCIFVHVLSFGRQGTGWGITYVCTALSSSDSCVLTARSCSHADPWPHGASYCKGLLLPSGNPLLPRSDASCNLFCPLPAQVGTAQSCLW